MFESKTSSFENSSNDDYSWRKSTGLYDGDCYGTNASTDDCYANSNSQTNCNAHEQGTSTIEVSPGVFLKLRGAEETWRAIKLDFFMPCECSCCCLMIFCIQDAEFVLCPECRVVSISGNDRTGKDGGVGLGFGLEELARWQEEIERERRVAIKQQQK
jgi:hypothetical protein